MRIERIIEVNLLLAVLCLALHARSAEAQSGETPFLPVWKMMNSQEKQQFIAGYVQGWRDAQKVTEIAQDYIRQNPNDAVEGLEKIKGLYDLSGLKPEMLVKGIDAFYLEPDHGRAGLSRAISAAKSNLR